MRRHGIEVKNRAADFHDMSISELIRAKEDIEDIIAEKEMEEDTVTLSTDDAQAADAE